MKQKINKYIEKKYLNDYFSDFFFEESKKYENNKEFLERYHYWFNTNIISNLNKIFFLLKKIKKHQNLNFSIIKKYINKEFQYNKVKYLIFGVDKRNSFIDTRIKIWFIIDNYNEKIEEIKKDKLFFNNLKKYMFHSEFLFGFEFNFKNETNLKIYPKIYPSDLNKTKLNEKTKEIIKNSKYTHLTSKKNKNLILHIHIENFEKITNKININKNIKQYFKGKKYCDYVISIKEKEFLDNNCKNYNIYRLHKNKKKITPSSESIEEFKPIKKYTKVNCIKNIPNSTPTKNIFFNEDNYTYVFTNENNTQNKIIFVKSDFENILLAESYFIDKQNKCKECKKCQGIFKKSKKIKLNFKSISKQLNLNGKILDVGCGDMEMSTRLDLNNKNHYAIEPDYFKFIKAKNKKINQKIYNTTFENFQSNEKFENIAFFGSINHIKKINETLKKARAILKKNGKITIAENFPINIIKTENNKKINASENTYQKHHHNFTIKEISEYLEKFNFKIIFEKKIKDIFWIIQAKKNE